MESLNSKEKEVLRKLSEESFQTGDMETKLINRLTSRGMIDRNIKPIAMKKIILQIAASILILFLGYYLGQLRLNAGNTPADTNMYALFLYVNEEFIEDGNMLVEEYRDWAIDLDKQGKLAYAEKLHDHESQWMGKNSIKNQTSQLSGYFVFYADDLKEAREIANTHPHTGYGGGLELRAIEKTN